MQEFNSFPDPNIDPRDKGYDYILQYAKAAWGEGDGGLPYGCMYNGRQRYREIRQYALGAQTINKYKKMSEADRAVNNAALNFDFSVVPIIPQYRNKILSKLLQRKFEVNCYAVDEIAQSEEDEMLNELKIKIAMREALQQTNPELLNAEPVKRQSGEPADMDQLEIMAKYGFKHNKAVDTELAIQWLFGYNNYEKERSKQMPDQVDFGAGGYKVYIDENGKPRFRAINLENFIVSYCEEPDFSDASYMGEAIYVQVSDLVPYFTPAQIQQICQSVAGKYDNPKIVDYKLRNYSTRFKCLVFDMEFIDFNINMYENNLDNHGNLRVSKTDFSALNKMSSLSDSRGESEPKYIKNTVKVKYRAKYIIGTNLMYDWGLAPNQPRKLSSWWDTQFDYVVEAWNFDKMQFKGITEGLIPLADDYYETQLKLQNIKRKLIPYAITIDMRALENVNYGKGGEKYTPSQLVDLLFQSNVLLYSGEDLISGNGTPMKPLSVEVMGNIQEIINLRNEMLAIKQEMMDVSGLNQSTFGSPDPKTLTTGLNMAAASTNDFLWLISETDKRLTLRLADLLVQKLQISVKLGKVSAIAKALGSSVVKTFEISPDISNHEFAIFLEEAPTQQQLQELYSQIIEYDQKGLLEPQDRILIENCRNLKLAEELLAFLVGKRKQEQQQMQLQQMQMNGQQQAQAAQMAEQAKQQTLQLELQMKQQLLNMEKQWDFIIKKMQKEHDSNDANIAAQAKIMAQQIIESSKKNNIPNNLP